MITSEEELDRISHTLSPQSRSYPSTHQWSPPITDLSPIEDVPSTLELLAEAEWLAEQADGEPLSSIHNIHNPT